MLTYMRKNASSWIIKVLFGIIVIVFVFFYGFNDVSQKSGEAVAKVGDRAITRGEFMKAYKNIIEYYGSLYKNRLTDEMIAQLGLKQQVLDELVNRELLLEEARRHDINVTAEMVRSAILSTPTIQANGVFNERRYHQVLSYYGMSALDYETDKKKELMLQSFEQMITAAARVSDAELRDMFQLRNEQAQIDYVVFDPAAQPAAAVSDEEAAAYFEEHQEQFRLPEKVSVAYLAFTEKQFLSRVQVDEQAITQYYDDDRDRFFEPRAVHARHILIKCEPAADADARPGAEQQARVVVDKLQAGGDFADLAQRFSQDTASAEKGGDLGWFGPGQMVKPFEQVAFGLQAGETSDLVETRFGFHIIRVEESRAARTRPLAEVRDQIERELRQEKARQQVRREAKRAFNRLFKSRDLAGYAEQNGFKLQTTELFAYGKGPRDTPASQQFSKEAFALEVDELAPPFSLDGTYYVIKQLQRAASHIPAFEAVRSDVVVALEQHKRSAATRSAAEQALARLQDGGDPADVLGALETATVGRQSGYIKGVGTVAGLTEQAFELQPGSWGPQPISVTGGYLLYRVTARIAPTAEEFATQRDSLRQTLLQSKQREVFQSFLNDLRARSEVEVNTKLFGTV